MSESAPFRTGYVAIVGRSNVGKSTLLNRLVGQKVSITSRKPQTTRQRITGILTRDDAQLLFVDTPGFQTRHGGALNRSMNRVVTHALAEVDVVLLVTEALRFSAEDRALLGLLPAGRPVLLVINKTDKLSDRRLLLPFIDKMSREFEFAEIVPVSAAKGHSVEELARTISRYLPEQPALYGADEITEASERFLATELIREKLFRLLGDELPYVSAVLIERFVMDGALRRIDATIIVDKESHKGIVVGAKGGQLKAIATKARIDMEQLFGGKVHLEVWVKVKSGWTENPQLLRQLGHG
ncbi:MAG: GTPase Era [Betaproteobacteria bacterium]|nr:GTPase Era [Betaproteobacteria bacterium]